MIKLFVSTMKSIEKTELTTQEKKVLNLIMEEYTSSQIAVKLNVSSRTIETIRKRIFQKTNTTNLVELVKKVLKKEVRL
jgi:DNA-binding CsgD family transcriptional regulator